MACSVKCQSAPGSLCGQLVAFGVSCCVANELLVASAPGSLRGQPVACSVRYCKRTWVRCGQLVACGRERAMCTWVPAWAASASGGFQKDQKNYLYVHDSDIDSGHCEGCVASNLLVAL